jgi:hypothetical protein
MSTIDSAIRHLLNAGCGFRSSTGRLVKLKARSKLELELPGLFL